MQYPIIIFISGNSMFSIKTTVFVMRTR